MFSVSPFHFVDLVMRLNAARQHRRVECPNSQFEFSCTLFFLALISRPMPRQGLLRGLHLISATIAGRVGTDFLFSLVGGDDGKFSPLAVCAQAISLSSSPAGTLEVSTGSSLSPLFFAPTRPRPGSSFGAGSSSDRSSSVGAQPVLSLYAGRCWTCRWPSLPPTQSSLFCTVFPRGRS